MELKTFSCYDNFVTSNEMGVPSFTSNHGALAHLKALLSNVYARLGAELGTLTPDSPDEISLVGFSKGCVVLNQIVHELPSLVSHDEQGLLPFWAKVSIYKFVNA